MFVVGTLHKIWEAVQYDDYLGIDVDAILSDLSLVKALTTSAASFSDHVTSNLWTGFTATLTLSKGKASICIIPIRASFRCSHAYHVQSWIPPGGKGYYYICLSGYLKIPPDLD